MSKLVASFGAVVVFAASSLAIAQPQPQPAPQPQAQPPPLPPAAPWYRLTLNDGRVVDVQIVGNDAANFHVQMGGATYSLPRANIVGSVALQPPPMYPPQAPPPQLPPPAPVPARQVDGDDGDNDDILARNPRAVGWVYFGLGYLIVAPIALARRDNDSSASAGLIPVVGPLIWTLSNDSNDAFEDGWDWLAGTDCLIQTLGLYLVISGGKKKTTQKAVHLTPLSGRGQHGFALSGSF